MAAMETDLMQLPAAQKNGSREVPDGPLLSRPAGEAVATVVRDDDHMQSMEVNRLKKDEERADDDDGGSGGVVHQFYFVKFHPVEDPLLKARIELAKELIKKLNEVRVTMTQELLLLKIAQDRLRWNLRRVRWGPRDWTANCRNREIENMQFSPENEKQRYRFRLLHESKNLREEMQILREMKQFESTMEQIDDTNDSQKSRIQQIRVSKECKKQRQEIQGNLIEAWKKQLKDQTAELTEKGAVDHQILALKKKLFQMNQDQAKAHKVILDSQKLLDEADASHNHYTALVNEAKELAQRKDVAALRELSDLQVERFMHRWNNEKEFRDEYSRRISCSLDIRLLSEDGRIRNPDEESSPQTPRKQQTPPKAKFKWNIRSYAP